MWPTAINQLRSRSGTACARRQNTWGLLLSSAQNPRHEHVIGEISELLFRRAPSSPALSTRGCVHTLEAWNDVDMDFISEVCSKGEAQGAIKTAVCLEEHFQTLPSRITTSTSLSPHQHHSHLSQDGDPTMAPRKWQLSHGPVECLHCYRADLRRLQPRCPG